MPDYNIFPDMAVQKLKLAMSIRQNCYIFGATSYGKTTLVKKMLSGKKYSYLSCSEWEWDKKLTDYIDKDIFVLDDMYLLRDKEKQQQVNDLLYSGKVWFIMINRSPIPSWLMSSFMDLNFLVISENELLLTKSDVKKYFNQIGIKASDDDIDFIVRSSEGNQLIVRYAANQVKQGKKVDQDLYNETLEFFVNVLCESVIPEWDNEISEFLMKMSVVDEFDYSLAEMITGNHNIQSVMRRVTEIGNFITVHNSVYAVRPALNFALRKMASTIFSQDEIKNYMGRAALYYEMNNQIISALKIYKSIGDNDHIKEALIKNARENPGNALYYELRDYYYSLSEDEILRHPALISGMSMLNSLLMKKDESIYWYNKLCDFIETSKGGARREAKSRKFFLDISLTHNDSTNVYELIKSLPAFLLESGTDLPSFSVTSNCPSTMNGGKDFSEWSKCDETVAKTIGKLLERVLGNNGKGLVSVSMAESAYEKGEDIFNVLSRVSKGRIEAESVDNADMMFAAAGIEARLSISRGNLENAIDIITSFKQKAYELKAENLYDNIRAFECRLALYNMDAGTVDEWLSTSPNENSHFYIFNRYSYLTKIRCYIADNNEAKAYSLIEKVRYYAQNCNRRYIDMECDMLTAIVKKRMGVEWQEDMLNCVKKANEYHFIRFISEEGAAVYPLLCEIKKAVNEDETIDKQWFELLVSETEKVKNYFPLYLNSGYAQVAEFSENGLKILRLQANGYSQSEICKKLNLTEANVKYHIKTNYRKLGASNKGEAILMARNLHLI